MDKLFLVLVIIRLVRLLFPWACGAFAAFMLLATASGNLPPLGALVLFVAVTTALAWLVEVRILRAFERGPRETGMFNDRSWRGPKDHRWR